MSIKCCIHYKCDFLKFTLYNLKKFFINFRLFDVEVLKLSFKLAFDKNLGLELFVFKHMYYDKSKKIFFSSYNTEHMIDAIGSFLLIFLNTDFEDDEDCRSFVFWFCFEKEI